MMGSRKTVFKFFTVPQYRQEEDYLSSMHEKGWHFTHATIPGFYHFKKGDPGQVTYRLDYNQDANRNKEEYIQLFSDCGWEYVCDFVGYSYFRKEGADGEEREEIFCDDASRLDMMKRVFRGKIIPLILIFALMILPQLYMNTVGYGGGSVVQDVLSFTFLGLAVLYLAVFALTAYHFYKYEKRITGDSMGIRLKYAGITVLIVALLIGEGLFFWTQHTSDYELTENGTGYVIAAERLNSSVVKEYDLEKGDTVTFYISELERGRLHLRLAENGEKPVFFTDFNQTGELTFEIGKDGRYDIEVAGDAMKGTVEVVIR